MFAKKIFSFALILNCINTITLAMDKDAHPVDEHLIAHYETKRSCVLLKDTRNRIDPHWHIFSQDIADAWMEGRVATCYFTADYNGTKKSVYAQVSNIDKETGCNVFEQHYKRHLMSLKIRETYKNNGDSEAVLKEFLQMPNPKAQGVKKNKITLEQYENTC